jgi:hypothetical protein
MKSIEQAGKGPVTITQINEISTKALRRFFPRVSCRAMGSVSKWKVGGRSGSATLATQVITITETERQDRESVYHLPALGT